MSTEQQCKKLKSDEFPRCSYFLPHKKRTCRMRCLHAESYCGEHIVAKSTADDTNQLPPRERVFCPLDPKHTCFADLLEEHLRKCNSREKEKPVYYVKNLNSGPIVEPEPAKVTIGEISDEELLDIIQRLEQGYRDQVKEPTVESKIHDVIKEEISLPTNGPSARKHLCQAGALLALLEDKGLLNDGGCFVEFGAGRGQLSYWIIKALTSYKDSLFVLAEKGSQRHKFDNKYKFEDGPKMERLRIDIEHLSLGEVPGVHNHQNVIGVCKHLCGAATDLALRCILQGPVQKGNQESKFKVGGMVMALCCHHRCEWRSFVGRQTLLQWGFEPRDFYLLRGLTSWATCGSRGPLGLKRNKKSEETVDRNEEPQVYENRYKVLGLSSDRREAIGRKAKLLLDESRVRFLDDLGYSAQLVVYTDLMYSLENTALVAVPKS